MAPWSAPAPRAPPGHGQRPVPRLGPRLESSARRVGGYVTHGRAPDDAREARWLPPRLRRAQLPRHRQLPAPMLAGNLHSSCSGTGGCWTLQHARRREGWYRQHRSHYGPSPRSTGVSHRTPVDDGSLLLHVAFAGRRRPVDQCDPWIFTTSGMLHADSVSRGVFPHYSRSCTLWSLVDETRREEQAPRGAHAEGSVRLQERHTHVTPFKD